MNAVIAEGDALSFYVVVYERIDGVVSVEDSGLCLSTAAARAKEVAASLLSESTWSEAEQALRSKIGNRVCVRPVRFAWEEVRDAR